MRVLSTYSVVEEAEAVVRMIVGAYFAPKRISPELGKPTNNGHTMDPLRAFSEECRAELRVP
jgi:hypothetical protein